VKFEHYRSNVVITDISWSA